MSMLGNRGGKKIAAMSFFWNAMYAGLNAVQSAVILFAISRTRELSEAGVITIGFTLANLAAILGRYGIRNYQVTDVREEFSFSDYFHVRILSVAGTLVLFLAYLAVMILSGRYSGHKGEIILEVILLKMVDAFEGLYVGRLQQKGRLDIGARIATIRAAASTAVIFLLLWFVKSLSLCLLAGLAVSIGLDLLLLRKENRKGLFRSGRADGQKVGRLLLLALPLCIGTAMHNYIGNAPKYLVDLFMSDEMQAISGYVMMPMFVITLLNTFLMQPMLKSLGDAWDRRDRKALARMIGIHTAGITAASFLVLGLGIWIGLPLLSWMYSVDLTGYRVEFIWLMIGGTLYTLSAYAMVLLTTARKQKWIIAGCCLALMVYLLFGRMLVGTKGLAGASMQYTLANAGMLLTFLLVFIVYGRKHLADPAEASAGGPDERIPDGAAEKGCDKKGMPQ
ncbi:MAG: lipopolysaccharide biosynthesis protein [Lachnospiraceae bacterium]|nr:lipopolysaccharide biosynthesis protein [Lachnospiraceae bacterium]